MTTCPVCGKPVDGEGPHRTMSFPGGRLPPKPVHVECVPPGGSLEWSSKNLIPCIDVPPHLPIHILWKGRTICGLPGIPRDWPDGHSWVRVEDAERATCVHCVAVLKETGAT